MPSIAIIGAGMSGLAAAHALQDAGLTVTLFEQSSDVGGRAATRQQAGFIYDHGAQYIKEGAPSTMAWITERFWTPDLIDIPKPVWIFDGLGRIQEGDPQLNAEQKLNYRHGLTTLAKKMAEGLSLHLETRIVRVHQEPQSWILYDEQNHTYGSFDFLLITIPAPQANTLIMASQLLNNLQALISTHLQQASYNPLISVMFGYHTHPAIRPYYALVNTDKKHAISWLAWEHEKSLERVPHDGGMLIAQMAPHYSHTHMDATDEAIIRDTTQYIVTLLQETLPSPIFTDVQRWRNALPATKVDAQTLNAITSSSRLAFCGDAFVGGRIHLALENGIMVSHQLIHSH
jgi:renalase